MKKGLSFAVVALTGLVVSGVYWMVGQGRPPASAADLTVSNIVAAAPGRIEGSADTIELGASTSGIIQNVFFKQGDRVLKGDLLARIECDDLIAEILQHTAEHLAAAAVFERLRNGSRAEEVAVAEAELQLSQARSVEADAANQRISSLSMSGASSHAVLLAAVRDANVAIAQVKIAENKLGALRAGPRAEEIAEAKARADSIQRTVDVTKARLARCEIRSPVDGVILHKYVSEGELGPVFS